MNEPREKLPPALVARINQIGRDCVLAGLTAQEAIEAVNVEARKHGLEYLMPARRQ